MINDDKYWNLFNGYGKFNKNGDEYEIIKTNTPVPWCNVLTNERFGSLVSSYGTVYSFYKNASEFKITDWCNDWANFKPGEDFTGIFDVDYNLIYGFGYVKVISLNNGIEKNMDIFVPINDDLKVQYITLKNTNQNSETVTITFKPKMALGVAREFSDKYIISAKEENMLLYRNPYSEYFSDNVVYLKGVSLDGSYIGTEYNSYTLKMDIVIKAGETRQLAILFGVTNEGKDKIIEVVSKYSNLENLLNEYEFTKEYWRKKVVRNFKTGDKKLDILANGWLLYQTIACRLFARTSLYQAGGAIGFRDQLQDSLAVISSSPDLTKNQIIKHSYKQFKQGDVLHWWHEHNNAGIRTYFSDDYLWLPYVLSEYIEQTKDIDILKIKTNYLEDKPIDQNKKEKYEVYNNIEDDDTIYHHALVAIKYGLSRKGPHGLLSIGSGDWNDGFSNIMGESVWLTFFMMDILNRFTKIADILDDQVNVMHFKSERHVLKHAIIENAYDGEYFIRAFYPDGTPIGSAKSEDCKIDLISQAWAAIALKDYPDCKNEIIDSLNSAERLLVDKKHKIVKLLAPPFDNPTKDPGYIKGYVPGVRENGGQYTHAAIWLAKAYFDTGKKDKGMEILSLINPLNHTDNKEMTDIYKVEPYVLAADVYANPDHMGRGGWTWYTGSAAWMFKVIEENFKEVKK